MYNVKTYNFQYPFYLSLLNPAVTPQPTLINLHFDNRVGML